MTRHENRAADPFRPNLEQQKKRARELLDAFRAGAPEALSRFAQHHPQFGPRRGGDVPAVRLADAQLVIARELRLPSWPALKAHIAGMDHSRQAMHAGRPLDTDMSTLHVRCGTDIRESLSTAGFSGDFLEYSNPFCQGPVLPGPDFLPARARFLTQAYGDEMELDEPRCLERLRDEERRLETAADQYRRVVLWFEHDSYDQLILARCLAQFARGGAPQVLELVEIDQFPGAIRFSGLGQLPPEALRFLWPQRRPITARQLDSGGQIWEALRSPDPTGLFDVAHASRIELQRMPAAVRRHLQELPSTADGTALTERLAMEILAEGPMTAGMVFRDLMVEREPLPWLGDLMFMHIIREMTRSRTPAIKIDQAWEHAHWPKQQIALTPAGRAVLAGERDYLTLEPPERWVGGVRIAPGQRNWRWDFEADRPVRL